MEQPTFSNLVFSVGQTDKKIARRERRNVFAGKDYERLLNKATKRSEMVKSVREKNPQKARSIETDIKWERAMRKAAGEKVKDNVGLLQKGLSKKRKMKEKSKAKWEGRKQREVDQKEKKEARRRENISKRRDTKVKKKVARSIKRRD